MASPPQPTTKREKAVFEHGRFTKPCRLSIPWSVYTIPYQLSRVPLPPPPPHLRSKRQPNPASTLIATTAIILTLPLPEACCPPPGCPRHRECFPRSTVSKEKPWSRCTPPRTMHPTLDMHTIPQKRARNAHAHRQTHTCRKNKIGSLIISASSPMAWRAFTYDSQFKVQRVFGAISD